MRRPNSSGWPLLRSLAGYAFMIGSSVALFFWIRSLGTAVHGPKGGGTQFAAALAKRVDVLPHVLLALVVIIALARFMGWLFRLIHQPAVIGEVVAGIFLGPSLLGQFLPEAAAYLLPKEIAPFLGVLAQVGVILFMFLVGLELDTGLLRNRTHASVAISHASILAPFLLGAAAALWLYQSYAPPGVPFTIFALFLGVSLSVTAFPELARILTDRKVVAAAAPPPGALSGIARADDARVGCGYFGLVASDSSGDGMDRHPRPVWRFSAWRHHSP
jgi:Sodium/hydrogen exchanger family